MLPGFNEEEMLEDDADEFSKKAPEVTDELGQEVVPPAAMDNTVAAEDGTIVAEDGATVEEAFPNLSPNL